MVPVFQCLRTLLSSSKFFGEDDNMDNYPRKRWNVSKDDIFDGVDHSLENVAPIVMHSTINGEGRKWNSQDNKFQHLHGHVISGMVIVLKLWGRIHFFQCQCLIEFKIKICMLAR